MRYQVKAVIFDILEECRDLKEKLKEAEILVCETFFCLSVRETLCREMKEYASQPRKSPAPKNTSADTYTMKMPTF